MATFPGAISTKGSNIFDGKDNAEATLTSAVTSSQTTIPVSDLSVFRSYGGIAVIENETILYTSNGAGTGAGNITGVTRGYNSTTAVSHDTGLAIQVRISELHINILVDEVIALQTYELTGAGANWTRDTVNGLVSLITVGDKVRVGTTTTSPTDKLNVLTNVGIYGSASDANPFFRANSTGLLFGSGGASPVDSLFKRSGSAAFQFRNSADNAYASIDALSLSLGGTVVFDSNRNSAISHIPNTTRTHDLGSTTSYWNNGYFTNIGGLVNVKAYGATGDGTTDDTSAVQAAINAAGSAIVYFPPGTFIMTSIGVPSSTTLRGAGRGQTILKSKNASNTSLVKNSTPLSGNIDITIEHLDVDGNRANQTTDGRGIDLDGVTDTRVRYVHVYDTYAQGILIQSTSVATARCIIENCRADRSQTQYGIQFGGGGNHNEVRACYVEGNAKEGIIVQTTDSAIIDCIGKDNCVDFIGTNIALLGAHRTRLEACHSEGTSEGGYEISASDDCTVVGNIAQGCSGVGITLSTGRHCAVVGNEIVDPDVSAGGGGIQVENAPESRVSGNYIRGASEQGILVQNSNDCVVHDNVIENSSQLAGSHAAIHVNNSSGVIVVGNRAFDSQTPKTQTYGLEISGTSDFITIGGNDFRGNLTAEVSGAGASDTFSIYGAIAVGGTTLFNASREVTTNLIPSTDGGVNLGNASKGYGFLFANRIVGSEGGFEELHLRANNVNGAVHVTDQPGTSLLFSFKMNGEFQMSEVTVLNASREWTINVTPSTDSTLTLGSNAKRFADASLTQFSVYLAASDANPTMRGTSAGLFFGSGGASPVDSLFKRSGAAAFQLKNAADTAYASIDILNLSIGGTMVFNNNFEFVVNLIPNASGTLSVGSAGRRYLNLYGGSLDLSGTGVVSAGSPTAYFRNTTAVTGREFGVNSTDGGLWQVLDITAGNATRLTLNSSGDFNIQSGALVMGGTSVLNSSREILVDFIPSATNTLDLGSAARIFAEAHVTSLFTYGNTTVSEAGNFILGTTTGTKFGTATTQKIGFFNAAPVIQQTLAAAATDAATTQTLANSIRTALINLGLGA